MSDWQFWLLMAVLFGIAGDIVMLQRPFGWTALVSVSAASAACVGCAIKVLLVVFLSLVGWGILFGVIFAIGIPAVLFGVLVLWDTVEQRRLEAIDAAQQAIPATPEERARKAADASVGLIGGGPEFWQYCYELALKADLPPMRAVGDTPNRDWFTIKQKP